MSVPWLTDLEAALFAQLPATDPLFVWEEQELICERELQERDDLVWFVEVWRNRVTEQVVNSWRMELRPGAWVGAPAALKVRVIDQLVAGIVYTRPRKHVPERPVRFNPHRLAGRRGLEDV